MTTRHQELISVIKNGENKTIEFKASFQKEVIESVVAFANSNGGKIIIGLDDSGDIIGVTISPESIQNYINQIKNSTEPSLMVDIEQVSIDDKNILVISVDEFPIKPVGFKGKYYKRAHNSNHQMSLTEISNMHLKSLGLSWDAYESTDSVYEDLDIEKIDKFFAKVNESGRFRLVGSREQNLQKLNLLKNNKPTNAAKLLFAKEQTWYNIHIGRFKTPSMILDDKMLRHTLFEAVEETIYYMLSHIKVAFEFTGEIERTEIFEYPKKALRELVLNAIVHRDYTSPIDIQIKIFDNSITFFEKLATDNYQAQTRNKLVAEAFYLTNDIEKYGSGYIRIRDEIANYPTMSLAYEEMGNGYLVTLSYREQKTSTPITTPITNKDKLLELIAKNPQITRDKLAKELNISINGIKQHILKLKKDGILERIGDNRTGHWKISHKWGGAN